MREEGVQGSIELRRRKEEGRKADSFLSLVFYPSFSPFPASIVSLLEGTRRRSCPGGDAERDIVEEKGPSQENGREATSVGGACQRCGGVPQFLCSQKTFRRKQATHHISNALRTTFPSPCPSRSAVLQAPPPPLYATSPCSRTSTPPCEGLLPCPSSPPTTRHTPSGTACPPSGPQRQWLVAWRTGRGLRAGSRAGRGSGESVTGSSLWRGPRVGCVVALRLRRRTRGC